MKVSAFPLLALIAAALTGCERGQPAPLDHGSATIPLSHSSALNALNAEPKAKPLPALIPPGTAEPENAIQFAVIGDYGWAGPAEAAIASLVKNWKPEFIITTGDNNYPEGGADTIDPNIGQYFHEFIKPYVGSAGEGADENRFFPSLGNHDWYTPGALPYLAYFDLPGNERYYDFVRGSVHFFALDSDPHEPDGIDQNSKQAAWLKARLAKSTARWQVVYFHHAPYSSGAYHGPTVEMQWPFEKWGVDLVLAGHDHDYERLMVRGIPYLVIGLGGASLYDLGPAVAGSLFRFQKTFGALRIAANSQQFVSHFVTIDGSVVDTLQLPAGQ